MKEKEVLDFPYKDFTEAIAKLDEQTDIQARKWASEKKRVGLFGTLCRMLSRFWNVYFCKGGRKAGVKGLFLAVNAGMYEFLSYAKLWELEKEHQK